MQMRLKKNISTAITMRTTKSILKKCSSSTSHSFLLFFYSVIHSLCQQKYSNNDHFSSLISSSWWINELNEIQFSTTRRNFNPQYFVYMSMTMYTFRLFMYCCWNVLWFLSPHLFHVTHLYRIYFFYKGELSPRDDLEFISFNSFALMKRDQNKRISSFWSVGDTQWKNLETWNFFTKTFY